ncbi:hypothetical protein [Pyrobaculum neutrophilum]|uniref:Transposase, IS605 OrfB n=1 Tax=Pyrobaculum neutrophilum (strain DSM 2338 / JCM 9278 / NBRC 100436 / V24Sta) TaxID=444157 RepID=B1YAA6_PYRNV|nr:hypothetical protein [Pyrobaculum neutrophilum]ACB39080.1 transposase, IS605 OrfB [Pyrobaculum neutrophilum V24Sta]
MPFPPTTGSQHLFSPTLHASTGQVYRTLKLEIPWRLVEERPDVLDLAARMRLAAEEFARKLSKESMGKGRVGLAPELGRLLTLDRREPALKMAEEVLAKCGLGGLAGCGLFLRYAPSFKALPLGVGEKGPVVVDLEGGTVEIRWPGLSPFTIVKEKQGEVDKETAGEGRAQVRVPRRGEGRRGADLRRSLGLVLVREVQRVDPRALVVVNNVGHYVKVGLVAGGRAVETRKLPREVRRLSQKLERISADIKRLEEALSRYAESFRRAVALTTSATPCPLSTRANTSS